MTHLTWHITPGKEITIECRPYRPAAVTELAPVRRGLSWRLVGQLLAGALWAGCAVGVVVAIMSAL